MATGYPDDWSSRRRRAYKRDDYRCQNCRRAGGPHGDAELHAHHIVPRSKGGTDDLSNLKTLCKDCHDAVHHKKKLAPTASTGGYQEWEPEDLRFLLVFAVLTLLGGTLLAALFIAIFGIP